MCVKTNCKRIVIFKVKIIKDVNFEDLKWSVKQPKENQCIYFLLLFFIVLLVHCAAVSDLDNKGIDLVCVWLLRIKYIIKTDNCVRSVRKDLP